MGAQSAWLNNLISESWTRGMEAWRSGYAAEHGWTEMDGKLSNKYVFGVLGEFLVLNKLANLGYNTDWKGGHNEYDILVDDKLRVEVKIASLDEKRNRFQFSMCRNLDRLNADIAILVCWIDDEHYWCYVIPAGKIPSGQKKIDITSHPDSYQGKWSRWIDAWHVVDTILRRKE